MFSIRCTIPWVTWTVRMLRAPISMDSRFRMPFSSATSSGRTISVVERRLTAMSRRAARTNKPRNHHRTF